MTVETPTATGRPIHGKHFHHRVHRRVFWTLTGSAIAAPLLFVAWFYFRMAACWSPRAGDGFVVWMCPNLGPAFVVVLAAMVLGLLSVASAVIRAGEEEKKVARAWLAVGKHREHYRHGMQLLEPATQVLVGGLLLAVPGLVALFVLVVVLAPRLLG